MKRTARKSNFQTTKIFRSKVLLFGESPSRIVITFAPENLEKVKETVGDCPFEIIGKVTGNDLKISINGEEKISAPVSELQNLWKNSLEKQLEN